MSFILDALKKSEAERQKKSTPGFADIPAARPSSGAPRWLWAVGGLLAINLTVLVVILLRSGPGPAEAQPVTRALETPDTAPETSFSELVAEAKAESREPEPRPAAAKSGGTSAAPAPRPPPETTDAAGLSTFNELRANGALGLPDLHLDLHVYGDQPPDRFVIINMNKYREGGTLAEGPRLKEIQPAGIVLEHQGTEFFLPRQ
jgi:general secretion pathway protein B